MHTAAGEGRSKGTSSRELSSLKHSQPCAAAFLCLRSGSHVDLKLVATLGAHQFLKTNARGRGEMPSHIVVGFFMRDGSLIWLKLSQGACVKEAVQKADVDTSLIAERQIHHNGRPADPHQRLEQGDTLRVIDK